MLYGDFLKRVAMLVLLVFPFYCFGVEFSFAQDEYPLLMTQADMIKAEYLKKAEVAKSVGQENAIEKKMPQENQPKVIAKESPKNKPQGDVKKKRFPWLLAVIGVGVVVALIIILIKKKSDSLTLKVTVGEGVTGNPGTGNFSYKKGVKVSYSYSLATSPTYIYKDLSILLDGDKVPDSGTIPMDGNHTLSISASKISAIYPTIYSYYWDNGWVELARWESHTVLRELTIDIDAWNSPPEHPAHPALNVRFDNLSAIGNILPNGSLIDDFNDGIIAPIWFSHCGNKTHIIESKGVLQIDIPSGSSQEGGIVTKDYLIQGDFDVQVDFKLNPEYHKTPGTRLKLFLSDRNGNNLEIGVRTNFYQTGEWYNSKNSGNVVGTKTTNHLSGKLRIVMESPLPRSH